MRNNTSSKIVKIIKRRARENLKKMAEVEKKMMIAYKNRDKLECQRLKEEKEIFRNWVYEDFSTLKELFPDSLISIFQHQVRIRRKIN